jgi:hypothetical protein
MYVFINTSVLSFADDLFHFNADNNLNRLNVSTQNYLDELEKWMLKWRLKIAAKKCSYNIYKAHGPSNKLLTLKIFGEPINKESNPKYLGITLDQNLSFTTHIELVKEKCTRKLNMLKVLNYKKYVLPVKTKLLIYNCLVRSIIEYGAPLWNTISDFNLKKLDSIQYHALRIISKSPYGCSNTELHHKLNAPKIESRITQLH